MALLDKLVSEPKQVPEKQDVNPVKELVEEFERELGRMLSPFELEDLQKLFVRIKRIQT